MTPPHDPLALLAAALDSLQLPHVFTGPFAVASHKHEPFNSGTIQVLVVGPSRFALAQLLNALRDAGAVLEPVSALRTLDRRRPVTFELGPATVELALPQIPQFAKTMLERALVVAHPGVAQGVKIATLEDELLTRLLTFEESDRSAADALLATTPALDLGSVAITLGLAYPPESDRSLWLAEAARRHGFVKGSR